MRDPNRKLEVPRPLLVRLLACRFAANVERPAEISLDRVARLETELGRRVPDDLIAAWAAVGDPAQGGRLRFSPEHSLDARAKIAGRTPAELLPIHLEAQTPAAGEVDFLATTPDGESLVCSVDVAADEAPAPVLTISEWLMSLLEVTEAHLQEARRIVGNFSLRLAGGPRVRHARYGDGEVLDEKAAKLFVRFDDGARRTLLRTAVAFL